MTDDHRHEHRHGPPWGSGRPPWWPQDEAWPPPADAWRGMRRRFVRKVVVVLALFFGAIAGLSILFGSVASPGGDHRGPFFFPIGLVVVLVVALLVARAGRRFAAPVADVMEAADRVASGDYTVRVQERGPREVQRLGHAFNEMTERLGTNEDRRRQLLADVAHELRTPLSVIQAHLEAIVDGLYPTDEAHLRPVLEETRAMSRLLDDLQTLSTAEARALRLHREPVEPRRLVDAAVDAFRVRAEGAGVTVEGTLSGELPAVEVDPLRIGEVLANLLANALRHTAAGGRVTVGVRETGGDVAFEVTDTGVGIAPEQLPHVFERFSKSPGSPGVGLGLAIARSLVEAHGGAIVAESDPTGTTITFTIPRATPGA